MSAGPNPRAAGSLLALLIAPLATGRPVAGQQEPAGTWAGSWEREGSVLEVKVTFACAASGCEGSFSSDQLRVIGIPFTQIRYEEPTLTWELEGDVSTTLFQGTVRGDSLTGEFREGEAGGTFTLTRAARKGAQLEEEEVAFASAPATLRGTVVHPAGRGPFPGVVLLHGSGPQGRWADRYLANAFARRGVAALVYDKRGVGESTGDWREAGFEELVQDAAAAVEALRARPRIARDRVGIHGHSQGGTIAPWVASASPEVAFVVASAAGGIPSMAEMEIYSVSNSLGVRDMAEAERRLAERYVRALVATAFDGAPRAELQAVWQEVRSRPWAFPPPAESDPYWAFSRRIASYDALAHWRRIGVPALLVYGEADERTAPRPSAAAIAEAYLSSQGSRLDVLFFPDADHAFRLPPREPGRFAWPRTVPGYPDRVIEWVLEVSTAASLTASGRPPREGSRSPAVGTAGRRRPGR